MIARNSPAVSPNDTARFAELLDRGERRLSGLTFSELRSLARLYRIHAAELAHQRGRSADPDAIRYLNAVCVRGYGLLYGRAGPTVNRPRSRQVRRALAATWRPQLAAWALLLLGLVVGASLVERDPRAVAALVPSSLGYSAERLERLVDSPEARAEFLDRDETSVGYKTFFGSSLFVHNTRVGLLSFATGILAGVPTVILQVYNGVVIGALSAVFVDGENTLAYAAWILPHAIPELTAISLCAAAGLVLGLAVAVPGRRGWRRELVEVSPAGLALFGASIPLFLLAAGIESFIRESMLGTAPRLAIAGLLLALHLGALGALRWSLSRGASGLDRSGAPGSD